MSDEIYWDNIRPLPHWRWQEADNAFYVLYSIANAQREETSKLPSERGSSEWSR